MELLRFTESYVSDRDDTSTSLFSSNLIMDYVTDLNLRDVHFVQLYASYKKAIKKLSIFDCFACTKFVEHVSTYKSNTTNNNINNKEKNKDFSFCYLTPLNSKFDSLFFFSIL
jgi:hypothetical protein